eukprot:CAMPEP_0119101602 /NCGR_PEP_ID=MMETSP1180-20130426/619_1 /TAXON_ID=3052 ORGANISM="Chlamydomonas cf sp, Strain CCMP681" /NCGR_SAMPLE_ID=MMETSP1180 /ASSEMBLY_ACC=CAM_ASM_000741 /LENGTH=126 /DNA_ID=CAMNT_0007085749 /DNA_START=78 /DNA_END=458 /DNA_ORIENTATION=+
MSEPADTIKLDTKPLAHVPGTTGSVEELEQAAQDSVHAVQIEAAMKEGVLKDALKTSLHELKAASPEEANQKVAQIVESTQDALKEVQMEAFLKEEELKKDLSEALQREAELKAKPEKHQETAQDK